jgi:hypothetical protein
MPRLQDDADNRRATGKVGRIFSHNEGASFRLKDLRDDESPPEGWTAAKDTPGGGRYFDLRRDHVNSNALYSLALVAATNDLNITIQTEDSINPDSSAVIQYMFVDWP